MAGSVTINSNSITGPTGTKVIGPLIASGAGNVIAVTDVSFASASSQTVQPPVGATGAAIAPPSGNTVGLTLKGVAGDTGIPFQPTQPLLITFASPTSPASFVITSAGAVSGVVEVSFF